MSTTIAGPPKRGRGGKKRCWHQIGWRGEEKVIEKAAQSGSLFSFLNSGPKNFFRVKFSLKCCLHHYKIDIFSGEMFSKFLLFCKEGAFSMSNGFFDAHPLLNIKHLMHTVKTSPLKPK